MAAFMKMKELLEVIGMSRSALYDRITEGGPRYDPTFPQPVRFGGGQGNSMLRWPRSEVENWMAKMGAEVARPRNARDVEREIERLHDDILRANRFFLEGMPRAGMEELRDLANSIQHYRKHGHPDGVSR